MRANLSVIVGEAELLRDGTFGEISEDQREAVARIENRAYALGGMVDLDSTCSCSDRIDDVLGVAIVTKTDFFKSLTDRLGAISDHPIVIADDLGELVELVADATIDRLVVDANFDGQFGLRVLEEAIADGADGIELGLTSIYNSRAYGPRLGVAGAVSPRLGESAVTDLHEAFELTTAPSLATIGECDRVARTIAGPTGDVSPWDGSEVADAVLVAEDHLSTLDRDRLDRLRGAVSGGSRPVLVAADAGSRLDVSGWMTTIGTDRHLVRPPTAISLVREFRERYDEHPPWLLSGAP